MDRSWISAAIVAALALCAFAYSANDIRTNRRPFREAVQGWQSYCPLDASQVHEAAPGGVETTITRVDVEGAHSHNMFAFGEQGELRLADKETGNEWTLSGDTFLPARPTGCATFSYSGLTFSQVGSEIRACSGTECKSIEVARGTFVYVYAGHADGVIAFTNYGDGLLYRSGAWCRVRRETGDRYRCPAGAAEPILIKPREVQFYSSLLYRGRVLLGEWPTGRIYVFDGAEVRPSRSQPPFVSTQPAGYEAQSMASYCGDLYVGYWPTGEVWKWGYSERTWSLAASFFPESQSLYPHIDRPYDGLSSRFYGRRITALVPFGADLYVSTANLNDWEADYSPPSLTPEEQSLYGAIWRISRPGCQTLDAP